MGEPYEVAEEICYLASKEAGYVTGAMLDINVDINGVSELVDKGFILAMKIPLHVSTCKK